MGPAGSPEPEMNVASITPPTLQQDHQLWLITPVDKRGVNLHQLAISALPIDAKVN